MKKIIIILMAVAIFSCSKNINENKKSSSGREIYFKTCEFMNKKMENELFLVEKDRCIALEIDPDEEVIKEIKKLEQILKNKELHRRQKTMLKKFNELNKLRKEGKVKYIDFLLTERNPEKMNAFFKDYNELLEKNEYAIKNESYNDEYLNYTWENLYKSFLRNYEQIFGNENIDFGEKLNKFQETVIKENNENQKQFCELKKESKPLSKRKNELEQNKNIVEFIFNKKKYYFIHSSKTVFGKSSGKEISNFLCGN
jgi:lipoprotein